jgi:hypothetical protein
MARNYTRERRERPANENDWVAAFEMPLHAADTAFE